MQTVLFSMTVAFWMDLAFVWENKYDLWLFCEHLRVQAQTGYDPMEDDAKPYARQIVLLVRSFEKITRVLVDLDN